MKFGGEELDNRQTSKAKKGYFPKKKELEEARGWKDQQHIK